MGRDTRGEDIRVVNASRDPAPDRIDVRQLDASRRVTCRPDVRQPIPGRDRSYRLRESEIDVLKTVGTFRVVPESDLAHHSGTRSSLASDLRSLTDQRLLERHTLAVNRRPTAVLVLTPAGRQVLTSREPSAQTRPQRYHAGLVKPRELAHDAQLFRLYRAEADRIERSGGHVTRVVLDYEIKRDYQAFLNRPRRGDPHDDRESFAADHQLCVINGHVEIPDLRVEYETEDGRLEHRDLELVTEHYSRRQLLEQRNSVASRGDILETTDLDERKVNG